MFGAILNDAMRESTAEATMRKHEPLGLEMEGIPLLVPFMRVIYQYLSYYRILSLLDQTLNDLNMLASRPGSLLQNGKPGRRRCYLRYLVIEKVSLFHLFVMSSFSTAYLKEDQRRSQSKKWKL